MCKLKNVCWQGQKFEYYRHPEEVLAPPDMKLFDHEFVKLSSNAGDNAWSIDILESPIPEKLNFLDDKTWFLSYATYGYAVNTAVSGNDT